MNKIKKRGQSAIEFAVVFGMVLFFFIAFFAVIKSTQSDKNKEKERIIMQNLALDVQKEIGFASETSDGYLRQFKIPLNILGESYEINITNDVVFVSINNKGAAYNVFPLIGNIQKGTNTIRKENGTIYLN